MGRLVLLFILLNWSCITGCFSFHSSNHSILEQVRRDEETLRSHPNRYPVRNSLAQACLLQAKNTLDPKWVAKARAELNHSLETQTTYEAMVLFARLENFSHHFERALEWAEKAEAGSPSENPSAEMMLIQFEALLGLGRTQDARERIEWAKDHGLTFATLAGQARLHSEAGKLIESAESFKLAADQAAVEGRTDLAGWAWVQQAGCYLDLGSPDQARPILERAEQAIPNDLGLALHWAEYHEAQDQWTSAAKRYENQLAETDHPLLHHLAWRAAIHRQQTDKALRHFKLAEAGYRKAIDAGEIFTLGALARLYSEADVRLPEAMHLAQTNLQHVKDAEAYRTLEFIVRKVGQSR